MRRILTATDFSEVAGAAVDRACQLAARHTAELTLLHVVPAGLSSRLTAVAQHRLTELAREAPVPAKTALVAGSPAVEIGERAARHRADLVVIGAYGAHWLRDLFLGSTAENVVDVSPIPVLLVKAPAAAPYATVLLAVDATRRSFDAARFGRSLTPDADHVVVHAVTVLGENLLRLNGLDDQAIEELRGVQLAEERPEIERLSRELLRRPSELLIEPGRPEMLVPEVAERRGADLVVVGVERGAGIRHALVGSVSRHAMRYAPSDVLVVPLV